MLRIPRRKRDVSRNVHSNSYRPSLAQFKKVDASTEYKGGNTLRSYQIEGINWLTWNWTNRRNSILADEMVWARRCRAPCSCTTSSRNIS